MAEETMPAVARQSPVFRFAPSPNGPLHLGHALSAFLNRDMADATNGRLLLRIEDIDLTRCTPEFERGIFDDLNWLGISYEHPVRRQSEHFDAYADALEKLKAMDIVYPAFMTRGEVKAHVAAYEAEIGKAWPRDPDGSPLYPPLDRQRPLAERAALLAAGTKHAWRLDMDRAAPLAGNGLAWTETGDGETGRPEPFQEKCESVFRPEMRQNIQSADPRRWGDVVLSRSDAPSSYHLSVTVDDALQGVTHVVRGLDLFQATSVHRLLQALLGLPEPVYHHHRLVLGPDGKKLSKSLGDTGLATLRDRGASPADIRRLVGL